MLSQHGAGLESFELARANQWSRKFLINGPWQKHHSSQGRQPPPRRTRQKALWSICAAEFAQMTADSASRTPCIHTVRADARELVGVVYATKPIRATPAESVTITTLSPLSRTASGIKQAMSYLQHKVEGHPALNRRMALVRSCGGQKPTSAAARDR